MHSVKVNKHEKSLEEKHQRTPRENSVCCAGFFHACWSCWVDECEMPGYGYRGAGHDMSRLPASALKFIRATEYNIIIHLQFAPRRLSFSLFMCGVYVILFRCLRGVTSEKIVAA